MKTNLTIYNHGQKLHAKGFWHIEKADPKWEQGKEYEGTAMFWQKGSWVPRPMKVKIVSVFKMAWAEMQHKDWLLHCDIFKTGQDARSTYQNAWKQWINPSSTMIAMRLERLD